MTKTNSPNSAFKNVLFWIISIALPFVLLLAVEFGMRVGGYEEGKQDLFVEFSAIPDYLIVNPAYVDRYFPDFRPHIAPNTFLKEKPANTFRVFVLGGSSTQGFPYSFYSSFSSRIEQLLLMETVGLNVEVINLGMTAVNSYVLWDLASKIQNYEPDAVVIYAGHNEYYGSFGVGSSQFATGNSVALKRLILRLKNFRLYQWLENLMKPEEGPVSNRTMMAKVVKEAEIDYEGSIYMAGIKQFKSNMTDIVKELQDENVSVYVGTLASNLKGQKPLGDDITANEAYQKAEQEYNAGRLDSAYDSYRKAKEYDEIRFRAPEALNTIIKELASTKGLDLVDIQKLAKDSSVSGIPDNSFFDDHLHPNWVAHQMIGEAFFKEMKNHPLVKPNFKENPYSVRIPISKLEKLTSEGPIMRLNAGYPFTKGLSEKEELRNVQREFNASLKRSYIDSVAAITWRAQRQMSLSLTDAVNYGNAIDDSLMVMQHYLPITYWQLFNDDLLKKGVAYGVQNRNLDLYTANMLELILSKDRDDAYFSSSLAALYLLKKDLDRAEYWLKQSELIKPDSPSLLFNLARLYAFKQDTALAQKYFLLYQEERDKN